MRLDGFWFLVTIVCLIWYTVLTLYVGVRGVPEIGRLIRVLRRQRPLDEPAASPTPKTPEARS